MQPRTAEPEVFIIPEDPWQGDDLDAFDDFAFTFQTGESKDKDLSDLESPGVETESTQRDEPNGGFRNSNATAIYASHYTGSAEFGGTHVATLTVLHDPRKLKRPLFNWLYVYSFLPFRSLFAFLLVVQFAFVALVTNHAKSHIQQDVMNFDEFWVSKINTF